VSVVGPISASPVVARVDSGSDDTLFPESVASAIGISLINAPTEVHRSQSQGNLVARFARVNLRMTDGVEFRDWPAWVGFVRALRRPVLGFGGCLQFFTTTFFGDAEIVDFQVNPLYPGT
jgi:hypothetical protein